MHRWRRSDGDRGRARLSRLIPDIPVIHRPNCHYSALTTRGQVRHFTCSRELTAAETPKEMKRLQPAASAILRFRPEFKHEPGAGTVGEPARKRSHASGGRSDGETTGPAARNALKKGRPDCKVPWHQVGKRCRKAVGPQGQRQTSGGESRTGICRFDPPSRHDTVAAGGSTGRHFVVRRQAATAVRACSTAFSSASATPADDAGFWPVIRPPSVTT